MSRKAFFLDRDGTINVDYGYVMKPEDVTIIEGVAEAISLLNKAGFYVIVISNQSGVARGLGTEEDVQKVNMCIEDLLSKQGAHIDAFYYCPHCEEGLIPEYSIKCNCRKPKSELFSKAINDFDLDVTLCHAVGDKERDLISAKLVGVEYTQLVGQHLNDLLEYVVKVLKEQHNVRKEGMGPINQKK